MKSWRHGFIKKRIGTAALDLKTAATIAGTIPRKPINAARVCDPARHRDVHLEQMVALGT